MIDPLQPGQRKTEGHVSAVRSCSCSLATRKLVPRTQAFASVALRRLIRDIKDKCILEELVESYIEHRDARRPSHTLARHRA